MQTRLNFSYSLRTSEGKGKAFSPSPLFTYEIWSAVQGSNLDPKRVHEWYLAVTVLQVHNLARLGANERRSISERATAIRRGAIGCASA
jgi:hypothetical protein